MRARRWAVAAALAVLAPLTAAVPATAAPAPVRPLALLFGDEFNGPSGAGPDGAKWGIERGVFYNNELQYYTDRNLRQDGQGNLVIQARREVTQGSTCPRDPVSGSTTCQYTSGRMTTQNRFTMQYGRAEARIKVSGSQGLWPAFWMLGADIGSNAWPNCGEIDIMESVGRNPNILYSTLHGPGYSGGNAYGGTKDMGQALSNGFHLFAVDWGSTGMTFSVDNQPFWGVDRAELERTRGRWVYDHPFFLILNNAVGGDFGGPPGAGTRLPADMLVDYVRVYG